MNKLTDHSIKASIGPININIDSSSSKKNIFIDELWDTTFEDPDLTIRLVPNRDSIDFSPAYSIAKGFIQFGENSYLVNKPIPYMFSNAFDAHSSELFITTQSSKIAKLVTLIRKMYLFENNSFSRYIMNYSLFWSVIQLMLLKKNSSFFHASVLSCDNESIAITGTGGAGKTSILFSLLDDSKYTYQSEDFGIINTSGITYSSPKKLSIYRSDLQSGSLLSTYFQNLNWHQNLRWNVSQKIFKRDPMIKAKVVDVLGERVTHQSQLKTIIFIARITDEAIRHAHINSQEMAHRVASASIREFKQQTEILQLISANKPKNYEYPTSNQLFDKMVNIYLQAFKDVDCVLLEVPYYLSSQDIVIYLKNRELL